MNLKQNIQSRTQQEITIATQHKGKLIQKTKQDTENFWNASKEFFQIITDILRDAGLAKTVPILPTTTKAKLKKDVAAQKIIPGITSLPVAKHLDEAAKRTNILLQRIKIIKICLQRSNRKTTTKHEKDDPNTGSQQLQKQLKKLQLQQEQWMEAVTQAISILNEIQQDRKNHISAIENKRGKTIFDKYNEYIPALLETQGKEEFDELTLQLKNNIFGNEHVSMIATQRDSSKITQLQNEITKWTVFYTTILVFNPSTAITTQLRQWMAITTGLRNKIKKVRKLIKHIRQDEWIHAKVHSIRIGKYGDIAKKISPKPKNGPAANKVYPTIPGQVRRIARTVEEQKEATLATHIPWTSNPPGQQNCHFLDLHPTDAGPPMLNIQPEKPFDDRAQLKYLGTALQEAVDQPIYNRIVSAHNKLPELFRHISTNTNITYPFK